MKNNIKWGYISQILNSGINILLLPFIVYFLSSDELGLWYTFAALNSLVLLLDFGFSNIMTRNIGYSWNESIKIHEHTEIQNNKMLNFSSFLNIFFAGKKIYKYISITSGVLLITLGTMYIGKISNNHLSLEQSLFPWVIYSIAIIINIYYLYWTPVLKGTNLIKIFYQVNIVTKGSQLLASALLLYLGFGLLGVSIAYLVSVLISRFLSRTLFFKKNSYFMSVKSMKYYNEDSSTFKKLLPSIYKQGILSLSNYLLDKFPVIMSGIFFGLTVTSQLGLTLQIMSVFSTIGNVAYNTMLPEMIKKNTNGEFKKANELLYKSLSMQLFIIVIGSSFTIAFGNIILDIFNSKTNLLELNNLLIIAMYFLLFNFQLVCVNYLIIKNEFPMVKSYVITSFIMILLSTLFSVVFNELGVTSILISQLIVISSYNAWKWPLYLSRKIQIPFKIFLFNSTINIKKAFDH